MKLPHITLSLVALLAPLSGIAASAHDGLHDQIAALSVRIEREPSNPRLPLARAELYRLHEDWNLALADLDRAAALDSKLHEVELSRARIAQDRARWSVAERAVRRFLGLRPDSPEGFALLAQILESTERAPAAVDAYTRAIALHASPPADLYLARADCERRITRDPAALERALTGIEAGLTRLGSVVALELAAVELESTLERFDAAIARLERLAQASTRKETWLARKGDVLLAAGRKPAARQAYLEALQSIARLLPKVRGRSSVRTLEARLRTRLGTISTESESSAQ